MSTEMYIGGGILLAALVWILWPRAKKETSQQRQEEAPFTAIRKEKVQFKVNGHIRSGFRVSKEGGYCYYDDEGEFIDDIIETIVFLTLIDEATSCQQESYASTGTDQAFAATGSDDIVYPAP